MIIIDSIDDSPKEFLHLIRKMEQNKTSGLMKKIASRKRCTSNVNM